MENHNQGLKETTRVSQEQVIVPKVSDAIEAIPVACALGTGQSIQIQTNIPLNSPNQKLHDIITHNLELVDSQNVVVEQGKIEEE